MTTKIKVTVAMLGILCLAVDGLCSDDPLLGRYDLGYSHEILLCRQGPGQIFSVSGMDFDEAGDTIAHSELGQTFTFSPPNGTPTRSGQSDLVTADLDGDCEDEIVMAWEGPDRELNIGLISSQPETMIWYQTGLWKSPTGLLHTQDSHYPTWNVKLAAGNFDEDLHDEFVVAYWAADGSIVVTVYDTEGSKNFSDSYGISDETLDYTLGPGAVMDIATGDFDADGTDEIILVGSRKDATYRFGTFVSVYDLIGGLLTRVARSEAVYTNGNYDYVLERIAVTTGNFDDDIADEAVLALHRFHGYWATVGTWPVNLHLEWHCWTYCQMIPFGIDMAQGEIISNPTNLVTQYGSWEQEVPWQDYTTSPPAHYHSGRPICLESGDLNGDGRDEIVFAGLNNRADSKNNSAASVYEVDDDLLPDLLATIELNREYGDGSRHFGRIMDLDADTASAVWLPELVLLDYAHNYSFVQINVYQPTINWDDTSIVGVTLLDELNGFMEVDGLLQMTTGDFDADGFHVGQPTWFETDTVFQPIIVLNAPPVHFDIIADTVFDIASCYGDDVGNCPFQSTYIKASDSTQMLETDVHNDWGIGLEIGGKYEGPGAKVEASFSASYGQGFSNVTGSSETVHITVEETAAGGDRVYGSRMVYEMWEYPVYCRGVHEEGANLVVAVPIKESLRRGWLNTTHQWAHKFRPPHEQGNILSYRKYATIDDNPEIGNTIRKYVSDFWEIGSVSPSSNWKLQIDDFGSDEVMNSWDANLAVEASVEASGVQASFEGHYAWGEVSTYTTTVLDKLAIDVDFSTIDMTIGAVSYVVTPFAYWSRDGALVIDYEVDGLFGAPGLAAGGDLMAETWWQKHYGQLPDPALSLPWLYSDIKETETLEDSTYRYRTKEIWTAPDRPDPGLTAMISVRVHNYCLVDSATCDVRLYYTDTTALSYEGGYPIVSLADSTSFQVGPIPPRGMDTVQVEWHVPSDMPKYSRLWAVIDQDDVVTEVHEINNKGYNVLYVPKGQEFPSDVAETDQETLPTTFTLSRNYPNPFNPSTTIEFGLPVRSHVRLDIFNVVGQNVKTLLNESYPAGTHSTTWDGLIDDGKPAASGVYFYRLTTDETVLSRKMVLLK